MNKTFISENGIDTNGIDQGEQRKFQQRRLMLSFDNTFGESVNTKFYPRICNIPTNDFRLSLLGHFCAND